MFASLNPGHIGISVKLLDGLDMAERHGFGGFDAQLDDLHRNVQAIGASALKDEYTSRGLKVGVWNLPFMPYAISEDEFAVELAKLPAQLESAAALGAKRTCMWILSGNDELEYDDCFELHVKRFQPIAKLLADFDMRVGLEFIGPISFQKQFKHPFLRSVAETRKLAAAIGPNAGLLIDSWHWNAVEGTVEEIEELTCDDLVHIHVGDAPLNTPLDQLIDNKRKLPFSTGVINNEGFMKALAKVGYDGPVTTEPFDDELNAMFDEESLVLASKATRHCVALAVR